MVWYLEPVWLVTGGVAVSSVIYGTMFYIRNRLDKLSVVINQPTPGASPSTLQPRILVDNVEKEKPISKKQKKELDAIDKTLNKEYEAAQIKLRAETLEKYKDDLGAYKKLKDYNPIKTMRSKFKWPYWRDWFMNKYRPDRICLINMELDNGFHRLFMVVEKDKSFMFKGKTFALDDNLKHYNIDAKMWSYDFHESYALPIKRGIPIKDVREHMMATVNMADIELSTNPSTLRSFIDAEVAKQVMKSAQLDVWLKRMQTMILATLCVSGATLLFLLYDAGVFSRVTG